MRISVAPKSPLREKPPTPKVPLKHKLAFSLGHVLNDLCASMWFTYLLLFFDEVMRFDTVLSGVLMLVGQIADGLSTILVGYLIDLRCDSNLLKLCIKYGRRKSWHLLGFFCVLMSFPFIFNSCVFFDCDEASSREKALYYSAFICVFQFGWATVQISHLSMIPDLSPSTKERGTLTSFRYGATVVSNITVYLVAWAFLGVNHAGDDAVVGPKDADSFRNIMLTSVSIGLVATVIFHVLVHIPRHEDKAVSQDLALAEPTTAESQSDLSHTELQTDQNETADSQEIKPQASRKPLWKWFCQLNFYQTAGIYMCTRLFVNLTQGYIPIYLQVTLQLPSTSVARIPLVIFCSSFVSSWVVKQTMSRLGIFLPLFVGSAFGLVGCTAIKFASIDSEALMDIGIYGIAILVGACSSALLITSLTLTADLIGPNVDNSAFVYGSMSLTDKLSSGAGFALVQFLIPAYDESEGTCTLDSCREYFRDIIFWICGGSALAVSLVALTMLPFRKKPHPKETVMNEP